MVNQTRSINFLPEVFRTETNEMFLSSTLDVLTSQPEFNRVQGFIGEKYGYAIRATDRYVVEPTKTRADYQLSPSLVFLKPETTTARDFIDYPGLIDALKNAGAATSNPNDLFSSDFYSWDSFADLDKIVNYGQYYWLPLGPDAVAITTPLTTDVINMALVIGQANYTSPNGVVFVNGLKVIFNATTAPASYEGIEYYVEGVGTAITLLPVTDYLVVENTGEGIYNPWSSEPWDTTGWSINLGVPVTPDYLVINRNSRDLNAWTRCNRWFNQNVIDTTIAFNGQVTTNPDNIQTRARRPIIEFYGNLSLWDSGNVSAGFVTFFDTTPNSDPLTDVVGQPIYLVDGLVSAQEGATVIFSGATDLAVRSTVYVVNYVPAGVGGATVVALTPVPGVTIVVDSQVYIVSGPTKTGTPQRWDGTEWIQGQQKTQINQAPLFDIVNTNDISLALSQPGSTFAGTKLFSYAPGTGANDPVLGFPISYSSVSNLGDINFDINLNSDTYSYTSGTTTVTGPINSGFVEYSAVYNVPVKRTGWVRAAAPSVQYQVFTFTITEDNQDFVTCDILADSNSVWAVSQVYLDGEFQDSDTYFLAADPVTNTTTVSMYQIPVIGQEIVVLLLSDQTSPTAYYTVPENLQNNPFNTDILEINMGSIRNHYSTIFTNAPDLIGEQYGPNNYNNSGDLIAYGTAIIQNSASLALPMTFLRKPGYNIADSLKYNANEYADYKNTVVDIAYREDYSVYQSPADILDNIIYKISSSKSPDESFFWSDMMPSGSPYVVNSYKFGAAVSSAICPLSRVYNFTEANYFGVLVYLKRTVNKRVIWTQLIINTDYTVSTELPSLTVNYSLLMGDEIIVKEYNQTYGSYIPNTPTKLSLYQTTIPAVITDSTYTQPTQFIVGHDGSYTKLYGNYINGQLDDFRDIVLLEFETRIYNNLKMSGAIPLTATDLFPGEFRTTGYTRSEIMPAYSELFLSWAGKNRIDYKTQVYNGGNQFTYNYNKSGDKLQGLAANATTPIQQGYWRGIYRWFYDTTNPAGAPWEMLGFTEQPSWWTARYGAAPYTSGNLMLWNDLRDGIVWNNGAPYVLVDRIRPQLLSVLPVDASGNLLAPFDSVISSFDQLSFRRNWVVGDEGPAESSYLKSSQWPFDLMNLLAAFKPAKFYNLFADRDLYKYDPQFDQYLFNNRYHLDSRNLTIYGSGTSKNSYINWTVDYLNQVGTDGTIDVTSTLSNTDVRLTYRVAGFTDKQYLKFLIERSTPTSNTPRLLIPDDSFDILLYDNVPSDRIIYSSVVVQRTSIGWTVWGNSLNDAYFDVTVPSPGPRERITVNATTIELSTTFVPDSSQPVAYGTEFTSIQGVGEFLRNYGRRQAEQGIDFVNITEGVVINWTQMIKEFMSWASSGWEVGSTISLNPNATQFTVTRPGLVVQPLTLQQENFVLNQNLMPLQEQNIAVLRNNETFSIRVLSVGDTVAYTRLNLSAIEHAVVFNNTTTFNDTIYQLTTGLRQNRIVMAGSKSAGWTGTVKANGFILNEGDIAEWTQNGKYPKGQIVTHKSNYWSANQLVEPQEVFNFDQWTQVNYETVKKGLLPNPSTSAYEATKFYDINQANLERDQDLLAFGLIGFRPRQYLVDAELSDISQVNVYINMIPQKGTNLIADAFRDAQLAQGAVDYSVIENWAIKNGDFGGVMNSNFVEFLLDQNQLSGNPAIIGFSDSNQQVPDCQQLVNIANFINYGRAPTTSRFLPATTTAYTTERGLPSAGYVNLNDVKFTAYLYEDFNLDAGSVETLYTSDYVWVANYRGTWAVFQPQTVGTTITSVSNNLDGTINVTFVGQHNLLADDPFVISYFDAKINGFYTVKSVKNLNTVVVASDLDRAVLTLAGTGIAMKLVSRRFEQASDAKNIPGTQFATRLSWIDSDEDGNWQVKAAGPVYKSVDTQQSVPLGDIGSSVAYSTEIGTLSINGDDGKLYRNGVDTGLVAGRNSVDPVFSNYVPYQIAQLVAFNNYVYSSDPVSGQVYCYGIESATFIADGTTKQFTPSPIINGYTNYVVAVNQIIQTTGFTLNSSTGGITFITAPSINDSIIVIYTRAGVTSPINVTNTGAIAVSTDRKWMYVANLAAQSINVFMLSGTSYTLAATFTDPTVTTVQAWGTSIATSIDGSKLIVGAPTKQVTIDGILEANVGAAYIYSRASETFQANGTQTVFTVTQAVPNNKALVYVNSVIQTPTSISGTTITLSSAPPVGSIVTIDYATLTLQQTLASDAPHDEALFGNSVAIKGYGGEMFVGVPYEFNYDDNTEGMVYRYTNAGQQYGTITSVPTVISVETIIFIDGYKIVIPVTSTYVSSLPGVLPVVTATRPTTAADIAKVINDSEPTNVIASADDSNTVLTITTRAGSSDTPTDIIDLVGANVAALTALGIGRVNPADPLKKLDSLYTNTQQIRNPDGGVYTSFGWTVAVNREASLRNSLVVSAITASALSATTFDFTDDLVDADTIFDNGATTFNDSFNKTGAVYEFDYLLSNSATVTNPGKYVFGQYCNPTSTLGTSINPQWGLALAVNDGSIVVGSPTWSTDGRVDRFAAQIETSSWYTYRRPAAEVDVNRLNNISIYDTVTNTDLEFLDYIDPQHGKMLSAVETNIDIISNTDPASYSEGVVWGVAQVGKTWLDTTNLRMVNYNQADALGVADNEYNSRYWGTAFPGSTADIYTWVSSRVAPINYSATGFVVSIDNYTESQVLDRQSDSLVTQYFFWVKNFGEIPQGKTLSPTVVSQYILNPVGSGVAFLAGLTTDAIAVFNSGPSIQSNTSALHIGYSAGVNGDSLHQDWSLIQVDQADSFLSGVPASIADSPQKLYLKYLNSFMGAEIVGSSLLALPDQSLPYLVKWGTLFRPRQTMFVDRTVALQNYIESANSVLIQLPVTETRGTFFLNQTGTVPVAYDVSNYWTLTNWWAQGYSDSTKVIIEVQTYTDLLTIGQSQLYTGSEGLFLSLVPGLIARVVKNGQGLNETYIYRNAVVGWERIGLENGTFQINSTLYTNNTPVPSVEIYYIIRWLTEQVFTNELAIENNRLLILMFNLIQSQSIQQNNYLPWLNKTSLIDVGNVIRQLKPYTKFQRDNQELVQGYINEVKPFHVYIKSYTLKYTGSDTYAMDFTDFDLPSKFNDQLGTYSTPQLVYSPTVPGNNQYLPSSNIWNDADYTRWYNNYGLSITNSEATFLPVTKLVQVNFEVEVVVALTTSSTTVVLANAYTIPVTGTIVIDSESLAYSEVDYFTNTLTLVSSPLFNHPLPLTATVLIPELAPSVFSITVQNASSLADTGVIRIGAELIEYSELNRATGVLSNVSRGALGTVPSSHPAASDVYIQTLPVNVMSPGRGYIDQPTITALIDTVDTVAAWTASSQYGVSDKVIYTGTGYQCVIPNNDATFNGLNWVQIPIFPSPRTAATFTANLVNGGLASVTVNNAGSGYAVLPRFVVQPSPISDSWTYVDADNTDVDLVTNQIYITGHNFVTGDAVVFTGTSSAGFPLLPGEYYYVNSIDANTIALYYSYLDAVEGWSTPAPASATVVSIAGDELTMSDSDFVTGSQVKLVAAAAPTPGQFYYYWVGRVGDITIPSESNIISLYNTLADAQADTNRVTTFASISDTLTNKQDTDDTRIDLVRGNSGRLTVTATLTAYTNEQPVREMRIGIKFDRTSYGYDATDVNAIWRIQNQYEPSVNMPGFSLNNYDQLMTGTKYPNVTLLDPAFDYGTTYIFDTSVDIAANTIRLRSAVYQPTWAYFPPDGTPPDGTVRTVEASQLPSPTVGVVFATPIQMTFIQAPTGSNYITGFGLVNRNSYWFKAVNPTTVAAYNTENDAINGLPSTRVVLGSPATKVQGQLIVGEYDGIVFGQQFTATTDADYNIEGGVFSDGYAPEELVAGVITDTINMVVTSKPGSTWNPTTPAVGDVNSINLAHTGFNMVRFTSTPGNITLKNDSVVFAQAKGTVVSNAIDFSGQVPNPVSMALYASGTLYDAGALLGSQRRVVVSDFTVDWYNQIIVVTSDLVGPNFINRINNTPIDIVLYEFGNTNQLIRSNSTNYAMRTAANPTPHTEILLDVPYSSGTFIKNGITYNVMGVTLPSITNSWLTAQVYANGESLQYNDPAYPVIPGYTPPAIKYTIQPQRTLDFSNDPYNPAKIVFDGLFDPAVDYISFVVSDDYASISGVSVPETQWFTGKSGVGVTLDLNSFLGDDNPSNIIVEINGQRYAGSAPTKVSFVATAEALAYPAPVYSLSDFNAANLIVRVGPAGTPGTIITSSNATWVTNYDPATLLPGAFDAEFDLQFGYFDSGVPFDSTTMLAVVFAPAYLATILGQTLTFEYDAASIPEVFSLVVTSNADRIGGTLTLLAPVVASDWISVTTFNRTTQQSLVTQTVSDATVSRITAVVELGGQPVRVTTVDNHNLEPGDYVTINGTAAPDLDGDNFYVDVITQYTVTLYRDMALTIPVEYSNSGALLPVKISYMQLVDVNEFPRPTPTSPLALTQPLYQLYNENRLWVTLIRARTAPDLRDYIAPEQMIIVNNTLVILQEIEPTDLIVITSNVPSASPDETVFRIGLDKYNGLPGQIPKVYRQNQQTRTYLKASMTTTGQPSDQFTVVDPYRIVNTVERTGVIVNGTIDNVPNTRYIQIIGVTSKLLSSVVVKNSVTNVPVTDFTVSVVNSGTIILVFTSSAIGLSVNITLAIGNKVIIQSEQIQFVDIDLDTGVISGLSRGMNGTIVNPVLDAYSTVQGILEENELSSGYHVQNWYSSVTDTIPLQFTDSQAANFLNVTA